MNMKIANCTVLIFLATNIRNITKFLLTNIINFLDHLPFDLLPFFYTKISSFNKLLFLNIFYLIKIE